MRQAGRYLPEYRELQAKYSFFERCKTPELACEITLQPIDIVGPDAAIIFSDILVIPQALGFNVTINPGEGPVIHNPVRAPADVDAVRVEDIAAKLDYVMKALTLTRHELNGRVPLIGFAGAPWTLFCYIIQGRGSKDFSLAKQFCYQHPAAAKQLLQKITDATIEYMKAQIGAGAQALQLFDSWAGMLSPADFSLWSFPFIKQIVESVKGVPMIVFAKGCWYALPRLASTGASAIGLDWTIKPEFARKETEFEVTLQGNFDPSHLLAPIPDIEKSVKQMIRCFGVQRYVVNLGHGITPQVPVDHAKAFVNTVKEYTEVV